MPQDFEAIRRRLRGASGRELWRSLEELGDTDEVVAFLRHEFPRETALMPEGVDRRHFLKLMGASLAFAGLGACTRQPTEQIVPYSRQPEQIVLGEPLYFATAAVVSGAATGLLVESHEGRPTKIEGNPAHPASLGATDAITQASLLGLYDPDRSQVVTSAGDIRSWAEFVTATRAALDAQRAKQGTGLRLLTETVVSPTLAHQIQGLLRDFPGARWHQWEAVGRDNVGAGSRLAFGDAVEPRYRLAEADVILSLEADLLGTGPAHVRYARDFGRRRRPPDMSRLYVVESTPSITGSVADHRLPVRARDVEPFARAVAAALGVRLREPAKALPPAQRPWVPAVVRDLQRHRGASLVVAGESQPPAVHALAHAMNEALGNVGRTVEYAPPAEAVPDDQTASLVELVADMAEGKVDLLVILGGNPLFTAPADLRFAEVLTKVALRIHSSLYDDETSVHCHWHVPEAHYLESWSDARAFDGTVSLVQPLIAPLYGGRTAHELLAVLSDRPDRTGYELVREYWQEQRPGGDFETFWRRALHDGLIPGTALPARRVSLRPEWDAPSPVTPDADLEVVFRADPHIGDGRFANNGWLQELPKPITKLTWENAALISPAVAEELGLTNGDVVTLDYRGRSLQAPVWILPGQATGTVTMHLGYGRARGGSLANGIGFNAYKLRTADALHFSSGLRLRATGDRQALACTQDHHSMEGRPLVRTGTLAEYLAHPDFAHEMEHEPTRDLTLYPERGYPGYAWGMAIDLGACIGCNACTAACQSENNIPIVGKDQVARGREMHWIRVDRYFGGALDAPDIFHQPVPCMHCENAPCEVVCPVNATVHSSEGLNDMVYNRCVGTRYCSNNCPYKVRRYNFYLYADWSVETLKMARNPDVTVRSRGVMEKCTYCVQRIEYARGKAQNDGRKIRDGEIVTACQQACPTEAIVFGDQNDPESRVAKLKADPRNYALLGRLNTRPRTTYLAQVRNPNPELGGGSGEEHG